MLPLVLIFLVMVGLLSAGWQWPYLLGLDGSLELWLRASWLACIAIPGGLLSWFVLGNTEYLALWLAWLAFGATSVGYMPAFRGAELTGQVALLALWIEVAMRAETRGAMVVAGAAAGVHFWMGAWGAVAKVIDPGWMPDAPDVLMRVYGPWAAIVWLVPAGAIIGASWMVGRKT